MFWCLGEVMADAEKSKAAKKRALKAPWAKLLSQYSQVGD